MTPKKKGAGGYLSRSQVVTIRLDPKLKFAAELAARKQRRTISSFIEWSVEQAIKRVHLTFDDNNCSIDTVEYALQDVWDVEEADRFVKLAIYLPSLLTYEEEQIWKLILECAHFWAIDNPWEEINELDLLRKVIHFDRIRTQWDTLHLIIKGEVSKEVLNDLPVDPIKIPQKVKEAEGHAHPQDDSDEDNHS